MDKTPILKLCDHCQNYKEDVEFTPNPYARDMHDKEIWEWLCQDCLESLRGDI